MHLELVPPVKPGPTPTPLTERYWQAAAQGHLLLQRCGACGGWQHYPRALCTHCWSDALSWEEASRQGVVWTFTVAHRPGHPAWNPDVPYTIAIIELSEGPRLLANLEGCAPEDVYVGMRVQAVFVPRDGYAAVLFRPHQR